MCPRKLCGHQPPTDAPNDQYDLAGRLRQFIVSKGISAVAKKYLKDAARVDADRVLKELPF
jgi:hypothetical protein